MMTTKNIDEIRIRRVDKLPTAMRRELQKRGIYDGLVRFEISGTTHKEVVNVEQSLELPSELIAKEYGV